MNDSLNIPETFLDQTSSRGKLKIFLGAVAGAGKTYAMLQEANKLIEQGVDCVAGIIETHGRVDTQNQIRNIEVIPLLKIDYKNIVTQEMDLNAILKRKPRLVLVDELAHTNTEGSRHNKRYQDVEEILNNSIDVYTTLNIQHIESLNDVIAQITGIRVHETVPDSIIENADEIKVVDIPPDDLIERLTEGKIYPPKKIEFAKKNFFRKGNLIALRELALRKTADRVDEQMLKYRELNSIKNVWPTTEKVLVCIGPSPMSHMLVRAAKRLSDNLKTSFIAVCVETPLTYKLSDEARARVKNTFKLAESLGGQTVILFGNSVSNEIINFANRQNVTKIVIGKPARPRIIEILFSSAVDDIIRKSGNIDIYVITGESSQSKFSFNYLNDIGFNRNFKLKNYLKAGVVIIFTTLVVRLLFHKFTQVNLVMLYQLAIVYIAMNYGKGASLLSCIVSVAAFDYFFVPPYYSFCIADAQYLFTFLVMLTVSMTLAHLMSTIKNQAKIATEREISTKIIYQMTCDLTKLRNIDDIIDVSIKYINQITLAKVNIFLKNKNGNLELYPNINYNFKVDDKEMSVAQWCFHNQQKAGFGTNTLSGSQGFYLPISTSISQTGVIGILPVKREDLLNQDYIHLVETLINQMILAVERVNFE